ncbi:MAG: magnesium transporter [Dehalococcoidales bacterium]|jgi:magnesium transporter|nr:magnesium transporter [Dehalococcoidales bacterium]MDX9986567.1 magnesium transporter [Dehalococcoidales bacterium]NLE90118.1 magnesium transporter [Dehalococcoidales bacterium]
MSEPILNSTLLKELFESKNFKILRGELIKLDSVDIADLLKEVDDSSALMSFRLLPKDLAMQVFDHLDSNQQLKLLEAFADSRARYFFESMPPDDRAELLDEVPAKVARRLLKLLSDSERQTTLTLLGYQENTAGRVMTPDFIDLDFRMSVADALERVRKLAVTKETIYVAYVMDSGRKLLGTVSLKDLVLTDPEIPLSKIMTENPKTVCTYTDQEEVARKLKDYDLLAMPVVDTEYRLVGIVTWDDVVDILEEEATEDIYRFGAVTGTEKGYFASRLFSVVKSRVVWLILLLIVNTITGSIIAGQEGLLGEIVILAAFIPLLIGTGGNIGSQSATVVIRGLATGEITPRRATSIILREIGIGLMLGAVLAILVLGWAYLLGRNIEVAVVVSITLIGIATMATLTGGSLPFIFRFFKVDPALVSAPFITTVMDIFGVVLYFFIANLLLTL